ncbi:hypothetical protein J5J86_21440 [Aquabacter sp. L1I39]|uniref:hypothetical protein n=1 Tax=Aquabacter sp. L1I39 TaxID=2820278 RepID=UPI001ADC9897|nr:hypothetical protein [Aquabacter sp. L1I39]QTL03280.1 hypothetical protein J5J86_21440 [Aquabacter sp. L1I39]
MAKSPRSDDTPEEAPQDAQLGTRPFRDPALGEKIEHIAGVVGYLFSIGHFSNKALAAALETTEAQMTRKRGGKAPVENQELSHLLKYCGLEGLSVDDLKADIDHLKAALERARIGLHGAGDGDRLRRKWLADPNRQNGRIKIQPVTARRAGLGAPVESATAIPHLRIGAQVRLVFTVPADGHVLLLNDEYLRREMSCLMPSCYAPTTRAAAGPLGVPISDPNIEPALTVLGPPGWCRLFAIWSEQELRLAAMPANAGEQAPFAAGSAFLDEIDRAIDRLRKAGRPYAILTGDYRVVE